uniref:Uncharacterized protein n=1 Tax=Grammatophora oceanica TaxID=210454 RepID=A0A7S1V0A2_9STRA|mmetsp:Transcript_29810/g.43971  ORF Transcript_29810/g.43971 Transcript_29810/m.43971 type:complete len:525 (+) Transcript_29810:136-1710(+)
MSETTTYESVAASEAMRRLPRFGHSNNFADLFSSNPSDVNDYIYGLLFGGALVLSLFFAWTFLLIIFKCLGPRRVGSLSGAPFQQPPRVIVYKRPTISRVIFCFCSLIFIIFSVLFVTHGLTNLQSAATSVSEGISTLNNVVTNVDRATEQVKAVGPRAGKARQEFRAQFLDPSFCLYKQSLNKTETGTDFPKIVASLEDTLGRLGDMFVNETHELEEAVNATQSTVSDVGNHNENIDVADWQALLVIIPFICVPSILLTGVVMVWYGVIIPWFQCLLNWVFLPILCIQTFWAYCFSATTMLAASANSDFCLGQDISPDVSVMDILANSGYNEEDLIFRLVRFYVSQCTAGPLPTKFMIDYRNELAVATDTLNEFTRLMTDVTTSASQSVAEVCGEDDFTALEARVSVMSNGVNGLLAAIKVGVNAMRCDTIIPIYVNGVYGATCTYSVTGVTWAFSASLVVAVMGMIMITLRSSWSAVEFPLRPHEVSDRAFDLDDELRKDINYASSEDRWEDETEEDLLSKP